ncbi:hypothetical protein L596_027789 [Steinernema carpocapsae]|uniref:TAP-C domain-containing protein n=1 Tax=Steinernema carpocapsae TaxID=34508 RepID=A0A4U5LWK2_STECR|nr:hypothetical protein L596_027789 [Steinernema carpocapsae]
MARGNRDVKARTMNRFRTLPDDDDGADGYDNNRRRGGISGLIGRLTSAPNARQLNDRIASRRQQNEQRSTAGRAENRPSVYTVRMYKAGKTRPDIIYKAISQRMVNFKPYLMRPDDRDNMVFYVADEDSAEALKGMSRRISDPRNTSVKFGINAMKSIAPWQKIPPENVDLIKRALQRRFNEADLSMDLTEFDIDQEFTQKNIMASLTRNEVMVAVADIIDEHFSGIRALSLRNNRLRTLDYVANLLYRAPKVTILDLSNNAIEHQKDLMKLRGWNLETLFMENNPLASVFSDGMEYIRFSFDFLFLCGLFVGCVGCFSGRAGFDCFPTAVHEVFPAVTSLDGVAVSRQFDITEAAGSSMSEDKFEIPVVRNGFSPNPAIEEMIKNFIIEFLSLYDGENGNRTREKLFDAYHEDSTFTCVVENLYDGQRRIEYPDTESFRYYRRSSHNIIQESKWERYRAKIVRKGRMAIAAELSQMPLTTHIKDSLILDIFSLADDFLVFSLQGLFRDGSEAFKADGDLCFFTRTFVALPTAPNKVVISNDMLTLGGISDLALTRYKNLLTKAAVTSIESPVVVPATATNTAQAMAQMTVNGAIPTQPQLAATVPVLAPAYDVSDPVIQNQMVEQFSAQSGMKLEWARKCLEDQQWNYDAAGKVFSDIRSQIPAEAFQ